MNPDRQYIEDQGFHTTAFYEENVIRDELPARLMEHWIAKAEMELDGGTRFWVNAYGCSYEAAWAACRQKIDVIPATPPPTSDGSSTGRESPL